MLRRRVRSDSCRPAGVVPDNVGAPEHFRDLTPDWSMRIRRAIISIGFVWLVIGAGVTTYYTVTGQTSETIRGVLTMLLGAVTSTFGLLWARRAGAITRSNNHRLPDYRPVPSAVMRTTAQPPDLTWLTSGRYWGEVVPG